MDRNDAIESGSPIAAADDERAADVRDAEVLIGGARGGRVNANVTVDPGLERRRFTVSLEAAHPWHLYAPGATEGLPIDLTVEEPARLFEVEYESDDSPEALRRGVITGLVEDASPGTVFGLRTQACNGARCEAPVLTRLVLTAPATGLEAARDA